MKSVYVAAPWKRRAEAREFAKRLTDKGGYRITRAWWDEEAPDHEYSQLADHARGDLLAVLGCDVFILLNLETSEGKAVETGVALACMAEGPHRPRMLACGPRPTNIFHNLPCWQWHEKLSDLLEAL